MKTTRIDSQDVFTTETPVLLETSRPNVIRLTAANPLGNRPLERTSTIPPAPGETRPPRWKIALITWPVVFLLISLISFALRSELATLPLLLRTLTVSTLMVLPLTFLIMPNVTRLLRRWLSAAA